MLRIAVIFEGSPFDRKGLFNAVHNRIIHLLATGECHVDAFCIHSWDTAFSRKVRHTPHIAEKCPEVSLDGISYRMLWYDFTVTDDILVEKLHLKPFFFPRVMKRWIPLFEGYDCIAAHSFTGGLVARAASAEYGIPYYVSWHGSDVHTHPMKNSLKFSDTVSVMEGAVCNFFVSEALMRASDMITASASVRKEILYNGVSERFERFPDHCRAELRRNNGLVDDDKVVAFVGSIVRVKNVSVLPSLFHEIACRYAGSGHRGGLKFWMVGDGKMRGAVEPVMAADPSIDVCFWGDIPSEHMPSVMNCIDVLVLPSLNEGLPLVCAEAIRCGASVAGSDAGGIPEVIGKDSVVPLGSDFVSGMASLVVSLLSSPSGGQVPSDMDWNVTAMKELAFLKSL